MQNQVLFVGRSMTDYHINERLAESSVRGRRLRRVALRDHAEGLRP